MGTIPMRSAIRVINHLKQLALTVDTLLKKDAQNHVKFHQADAAVTKAALEAINTNNSEILSLLEINDENRDEIKTLLEYKSQQISAAGDEKALNNAVFGGGIFGYFDAIFPKKSVAEEKTRFMGKLEISPATQDREIREGSLVNVTVVLDRSSAIAVTQCAGTAISAFNREYQLGLQTGRLTSLADTEQRHVSLALRAPYSEALQATVGQLDRDFFIPADEEKRFVGSTRGELVLVLPPDIRAAFSTISSLDEQTKVKLLDVQQKIAATLQGQGNKLPPLHITQSNMPITIDARRLMAFNRSTTLHALLSQFNLNLNKAIDAFAQAASAQALGGQGVFAADPDSALRSQAKSTVCATAATI